VPSLNLIHPTVWLHYINVTDRETDRQRTDSTGQTVLQTVAQKQKSDTLRTNGPVIKSVVSVLSQKGVYDGERFVKEVGFKLGVKE